VLPVVVYLLFVALLMALIAIQALRTWPRAPAAPLCSPSRTLLGVVAAAGYARGRGLRSFVTVLVQIPQLAAEGIVKPRDRAEALRLTADGQHAPLAHLSEPRN
jgi:hypothetical protein